MYRNYKGPYVGLLGVGSASYGLLLGLSGFRYTVSQGLLELAPQLPETKGRLFFSVDSGWGSIHYEKRGGTVDLRIEVDEGELSVHRIRFGGPLVKGILRAELEGGKTAGSGKSLKVRLG